MQCPVDGTTLAISDKQGIEIDYCPQCRGIWLDRGELEKLTNRLASVEQRHDSYGHDSHRPTDYPSDHDYDNHGKYYEGHKDDRHYKHKKKHKGLLGELLDF